MINLSLAKPPCLLRCLPILLLPFASPSTTASAPVPPKGITIADSDRQALTSELTELTQSMAAINPASPDYPDVVVFHKAVSWALAYDEFYRSNEVDSARRLIREGRKRAAQLTGNPPSPSWTTATGLVVRAYTSRIDDSIQPYGLVVPAGFSPDRGPYRLDVWLHGRDNHLTELKFIDGRMKSAGEFTPPDTLVLHAYGRYCNAFKFAGETDVFEAIRHAQSRYPIDKSRISIRGFSMGGAGTWHLAAHHPGFWAGAAPGAGFAETAVYTGILKKQPGLPGYQQTLWQWYDATDYALNFFNLPVIAYSGEIDNQKQAADIMAEALALEGMEMSHLIGPNTAHKYEPKTKVELARQFDALMESGHDPLPPKVRFTTRTLRYNRSHWLVIEGLENHWEPARIEAELIWDEGKATVRITCTNVTAFTLDFTASPSVAYAVKQAFIQGAPIKINPSGNRKRTFVKNSRDGTWHQSSVSSRQAHKRPGLQGPIDDAFTDRFIMVRPTGKPLHQAGGDWVQAELARATNQWRAQFRGFARVKNDTDITDQDIRDSHLILWGDPRSNRVLARVAAQLPIRWSAKSVRWNDQAHAASDHVVVLIQPNPLNPERYVVLNSGFTFADFGDQSNALQTPKLPDWALVNITVPRADRLTRGITDAGFFDERWQVK